MALKVPLITFGESSLKPQVTPFVPRHMGTCEFPAPSKNGEDQSYNETVAGVKRGSPSETDEEAAKRLKSTVLAPFFDRIRQDGGENVSLKQINAELSAMNERHRKQLASGLKKLQGETGLQVPLEAPDPHGKKRKAPPVSPMKTGTRENGGNERNIEGHLVHLCDRISKDLEDPVVNETIHLCGLGPLKIIDTRPDVVLNLAHQKLHSWPYKNVPMCWRRLYEDATLSKAACMLREEAERICEAVSFKKRKLNVDEAVGTEQTDPDWLTKLVTVLDKGITLTGAPGRAAVFEDVLQQLDNYVKDEPRPDIPVTLNFTRRKELKTDYPIARMQKPMNFEAFQVCLEQNSIPRIIPGTMVAWPAISLWQNPAYLMRITLGGRRLVPIEVGKSYLDDAWSQKMIPFHELMTDYLLPKEPKDVGYLAQHDLFAQIPALKNDIAIPDYCYTTPPPPSPGAARTAGLASVLRLDEPLINAWLGPKGTKTPLHTDPYHNILCQVVGYKYVRLYSPEQTPNLYPCGVDDNGIDMSNTSQVDVSVLRTRAQDENTDVDAQKKEHLKFPLVKDANFVEGILGPGECLYIPLGWWHYVESQSTSFSVSFWWN